MARFFNLELDTAAPQITFGQTVNFGPGVFVILYDVDEPDIYWAQLTWSGGTLDLNPTTLITPVPLFGRTALHAFSPPGFDPTGEIMQIDGYVADEVGNEAFFTHTVTRPGIYELELDTTPPQVSWGQPVQAGSHLTIPYTIDEPEMVSAEAIDAANNHYPLTVTEFDVSGDLPLGTEQIVEIRAVVRDDVLNEAEISLPVFLAPPTEGRETGGAKSFTYGTIGIREEFRFEGTTSLSRVEQQRFVFSGSYRAHRHIELATSCSVQLARPREFTYAATRAPGQRYTALLREDEEVLLSL